MSTPDEIRTLYIETLARAQLAAVKFVAHDGYLSFAMRTNEDAAEAAIDALAEAGLLPIAVEGRYIGRGLQRRTRYVTDWVEAE